MSTDKMPNSPSEPTAKSPAGNPQTQVSAGATSPTGAAGPAPTGAAPAQDQPAPASPQFDLATDMAGIIEQQADVLAQRLVYHCQMMYGVGSVGVDIVNARNSTLVLANALRNRANAQAEESLVGMGDPQLVQINDGTLPFMNNAQVAGLFEGLIIDTLSRAYADNPSRLTDARNMLSTIFQPANNEMDGISRMLSNPRSLVPGLPPSR